MKIKARAGVMSRFNAINIGCDALTFKALKKGKEVDVKDKDVAEKLISKGICVKADKIKKSKSKEK